MTDWVTQTGIETQRRQTKHREQWIQLKIRRDDWWFKQKRAKEGDKLSYFDPIPTVGTDVIQDVDLVGGGKEFQYLQRHDSDTE